MRPLNSSLVSGSPLTSSLVVGLLALLTSFPAAALFGTGPLAWLSALMLGSGVWLGLLSAVSFALLPRIHVAADGGSLRVRGRDYDARALRAAARNVSASPTASYLIYRFTLDDGRRFRLIVAGRPFRGLTPEGLRALRALIEASDIAEPSGLTAEQQRIQSNMQMNRHAVSVGKEAVLRDIDDLSGLPPAPIDATPAPVESTRAAGDAESHPEMFVADDAEAAALIRRRADALFTWRRLSGAVAGVGLVLCVMFAVLTLVESGQATTPPSAALAGITGLLLGTVGGLAWAVTADASVRQVRRLADEWWATADAAAQRRGMPGPFVTTDATGARRVTTVLAFVCTVVAVIAVPTTIAALFEDDVRILVVPLAVISAGLVVGSIVCWRHSRRDAREVAERVAQRAGERLGGRRES